MTELQTRTKYTYDAQGRRVEKTTSAQILDYVYDNQNRVIAEFLPSQWTTGYAYLGGQLLAEYTQGTTYFVTKDHLGSARLVTAVNASVVDSMDYYPYGIQMAGGTATTHKFTGDERDSETGLDHTPFRQYSSSVERWMTPDPAGRAAVDPMNPQSWNRYTYVLNNPTLFVDPSGLDTCYWDSVNNETICIATVVTTVTVYGDDGGSNDTGIGTFGGGAGGEGMEDPNSLLWCMRNLHSMGYKGDLRKACTPGGGNSSGGGRVPWYKNSCITGAIGSGLLHVGIDAIGLIPEGGLVSRAIGNFAGYRGIVATQQGTKALQASKFGAGAATTGVGAEETSATGFISTGLGVAGIAATLASATPVVGQIISGASIVVDIYGAGKEIATCH